MQTLQRLFSPIIKVHWAGWESDTYRLQQAGWSISAHQDPHRAQLQIAIKHPAYRVYGLSDAIDVRYMETQVKGNASFDYLRGLIIPFRYMSNDLRVICNDLNIGEFSPVDTKPQIMTMQERSIDDFKIFKESICRTDEIIVEPAKVSEILKQIIGAQSIKQKEIREKRRKQRNREGCVPESMEDTNVHAQIVTLAA